MTAIKAATDKKLLTLTIVRFNESVFEVNIMIDTDVVYSPNAKTLVEGVADAIDSNLHLAVDNDLEVDEELKQSRIDAVAEFLEEFNKAETLNDMSITKDLDDGYCEEEETDNISYIQSEVKPLYHIQETV